MKENKIVIINGEKYYTLPENSYYSWHYEEKSLDGETTFNYSYTREPVEGNTTVYADHYVTHIHLRDDVKISTEPNNFVNASWDSNKPDPFVRL